MKNTSYKEIKRENSKYNRHMKYRKISTPKPSADRYISKPYSNQFRNGTFQYDYYSNMNPIYITWVYIKNIILFTWPALLIHGFLLIVGLLNGKILNDHSSVVFSEGGFQVLFVAYAICLFFSFRRISDHMAYFNIEMLISKHEINQSFLSMIYRSNTESKEFKVMEHYRQRFNKYSLFPSLKEMALEEQLYQRAINGKNKKAFELAKIRRERLSVFNKREEHIAAKEIADWKQEKYGGPNEYDQMVSKYQKRTIPAIKDIINEVQSSNI